MVGTIRVFISDSAKNVKPCGNKMEQTIYNLIIIVGITTFAFVAILYGQPIIEQLCKGLP
jgi:hypothetical protein